MPLGVLHQPVGLSLGQCPQQEAGASTSADLITITVFAAFAVGHVLDIEILGVGMAVAVAVDATLVRGILVPSLMRLLRDLNWWAPGPVNGLIVWLGLY
jgi:RND superfamily putative drug exporter